MHVFLICKGKETLCDFFSHSVFPFPISKRILDLNLILKIFMIWFITLCNISSLLVFLKPVNYIEFFFLSNESKCKVKMEEKQDKFSWGHYDSKKKWGKPELWFKQCTWYWNECGSYSLHPLVTGIWCLFWLSVNWYGEQFMGSILWGAECSNVHHPDNHVLHRLLIHPFQQIMHISPFLAHIDSVHTYTTFI